MFSSKQSTALFKALEQHWQFDPNYIDRSNIDTIQDYQEKNDIGKSPIVAIGLAIVLGIVAMFIASQFKALHFAVESYYWLIPCVVICIVILYPIIHLENKMYPFLSAILTGSLLGCSVYFLSLQINRLYNEKHAQTISITATLNRLDNYSQVWQLNQKFAQEIKLNEIYVHKNWQGYNNQLEQGKTYTLSIKKGLFNDYFVDKTSFQHAQMME